MSKYIDSSQAFFRASESGEIVRIGDRIMLSDGRTGVLKVFHLRKFLRCNFFHRFEFLGRSEFSPGIWVTFV